MCRIYLRCYVFILTLLDISLNVKLTARGESHGVSIHNSLVEGITFQEWGKESGLDVQSAGAGSVEGVLVSPGALSFGRAQLAAPHVRLVTVTNTANNTLHLASVAGTTPDFHASFFESKTLPPQGNTTFSVVYLGRREGPVSAHLYIHTSLGVYKFPVSAVGVASDYDVWPLVGVRVPSNASVEAELRLYNPTDAAVTVTEVYSTGSWLGLRLPGGGDRAPRDLWVVPPRAARTLVTLRLAHAAHRSPADHLRPLTAYVRVRADIPGGGLLVAVEARGAPAGEHARPLHLRLRPRGSSDGAHTVELQAANSGAAGVALDGAVSARCSRSAPPPCAPPPRALHDDSKANGGTATGAHLTMLRTHLEPHEEFVRVARLKLDYGELWSQVVPPGAAAGPGDPEEAWCSGCVRLGRAVVPFSLRLLPGGLRFLPERIDAITAEEDFLREREVRVHNAFRRDLRLLGVTVPDEVGRYFHVVDHSPLRLAPGATAGLLQVAARDPAPPAAASLAAALTAHTDLGDYSLPLYVSSGRLLLEWEWANATAEHVELGTVGASWTRRVGLRLVNPAPGGALCASRLAASLGGAGCTLSLEAGRRCVAAGSRARAWLTVVAPAAEGALRGELEVETPHAVTRAALSMRVRAGSLRVLPLDVPPAAPFASSWCDVEVESSMAVSMRVFLVDQPSPPDAALSVDWSGPGLGSVSPGRRAAARLRVSPEELCRPRCYTGLSLDTPEGAAWAALGAAYDDEARRRDAALLHARLAQLADWARPGPRRFTLRLHTDEALHLAAPGAWRPHWPRLLLAGAGDELRAGVGRAEQLRLLLRSPASEPLLLHALLPRDGPPHPPLPPAAGGEEGDPCGDARCRWAGGSFRVAGWRVLRGSARPWNESRGAAPAERALPPLLLSPGAELEIELSFAPEDEGAFAAYLYLRNNLTIVERVALRGRGELPSFSLAGRRAGGAPFSFSVSTCSWRGGGPVARRVLARNAGRVPAALGGWRVAREACEARGFRVSPCAPLTLAPNASAPLTLAFSPDYSLARVSAPLTLDTDLGPVEFTLLATVPAKVLAKCAARAPRPPWDGLLRGVSALVVFAAFALVLGAAAIDAERLLRKARAARAPAPPSRSAPLDLRRLAPDEPPAPRAARAAPRRRRSTRRLPRPLDPRAERRAFERWRAGVLRRDDDSSRSSEDVDLDPDDAAPAPRDSRPEPAGGLGDRAPAGRGSPAADEGRNSTGSDDSTPPEDRDDADDEPDPGDDDSPTDGPEREASAAAAVVVRPVARSPPAESATRGARSTGARRGERARPPEPADRRPTPARQHARKERAGKRRAERGPPSPAPRSPSEGAAAGAGEAGVEVRGLRWGASFSSVVASRAAPLAPIGSDVRRREPERPADNSLFYFNGASEPPPRPEPEFPWRPSVAADRPAFVPAAGDYSVPEPCPGAVWGGAWGSWGAGGLRPPPGFSPPEAAPQRSYDPFRSLASIWAPAPHDWRPPAPRRDPPAPRRDPPETP